MKRKCVVGVGRRQEWIRSLKKVELNEICGTSFELEKPSLKDICGGVGKKGRLFLRSGIQFVWYSWVKWGSGGDYTL